ncbi:unnamed protein product [Rhizophagus irregularis]|nr:unnamed protein product [Rhizophagus irregularis]
MLNKLIKDDCIRTRQDQPFLDIFPIKLIIFNNGSIKLKRKSSSIPDDAALTLIQCRRAYQPLFTTTRLHNQKQLWRGIARDIRNNHIFRPTRKQCREKWNALKSGYENLERLINRNPEGYPTRTPTLHDERFHQELSDEFWRVERKYLLFN